MRSHQTRDTSARRTSLQIHVQRIHAKHNYNNSSIDILSTHSTPANGLVLGALLSTDVNVKLRIRMCIAHANIYIYSKLIVLYVAVFRDTAALPFFFPASSAITDALTCLFYCNLFMQPALARVLDKCVHAIPPRAVTGLKCVAFADSIEFSIQLFGVFSNGTPIKLYHLGKPKTFFIQLLEIQN